MAEQRTPRQMVKALVRGETLARPLLLPAIFALGSRLGNLPLRDFLGSPTKIANALRQIRSTLKIDGMTCYWDPYLELEALGGNIEWKSEGSAPKIGTKAEGISSSDLRQRMDAAGGILKMGRAKVAVEVLQRLKLMLKDEPALMVRLTGPHTLAMQLIASAQHSSDSSVHSSLGDMLEFAGDITEHLARGFLEAGADVIFLAEHALPMNASDFERWRNLLDPVVNAIRFFEALPVLLVEETISSTGMALILGHNWDCALCFRVECAPVLDRKRVAPWLGIRMEDLDVARSEAELAEWAASILDTTTSLDATFLSSSDLPASSDVKALVKNLSMIQAHLASIP